MKHIPNAVKQNKTKEKNLLHKSNKKKMLHNRVIEMEVCVINCFLISFKLILNNYWMMVCIKANKPINLCTYKNKCFQKNKQTNKKTYGLKW